MLGLSACNEPFREEFPLRINLIVSGIGSPIAKYYWTREYRSMLLKNLYYRVKHAALRLF